MPNAESRPKLDHRQPVSLVPILDARWAWGRSAVASASLLSVCWLILSYLPLANSRVWSHFSSPEHFPLLAGVEGATYKFAFNSVLQKIYFTWGITGVSMLLTCTAMFSLILLFLLFSQIHGRHLLSSASVLLTGLLWALSSASLQSSHLGVVAYALLLWAIAQLHFPRTPNKIFIGTIVTTGVGMCLWVNSTSSFTIGLIIVCGACLENLVRAAIQRKNFRDLWSDRRLRNSVYALEAGILGLLCNPQGIKVLLQADYLNVFVSHYASRWWIPLTPGSVSAAVTGAFLVGVLVLLRTSRAPLLRGFMISCVALWGLAWLDRSALIWSIPLTVLLIQPLLAERLDSMFPSKQGLARLSHELTAKDFRYTLLTLLPLWIGFSFSPLGNVFLGGTPRDLDEIVSQEVPVELAAHLRAEPPLGQVIHPAAWGDWLSFAGPEPIQLFLSLEDLGRAPQTLFLDQLDILNTSIGWEQTADRYRVNTIILEPQSKDSIHLLENAPAWRKSYDDNQAVVFRRKLTLAKSDSLTEIF